MILDDASQRNMFSADDYLIQNKPVSVLCLPVLRQAKLIGMLYLENNLVKGAFTPDRIAVLEVLAAQAAISLDNSRLYAALRESQRLLQSIIDNSAAVIYVKDLGGRYLLINRRYEELFHVKRQDIAGKTDYDIFPRELADAYRAFDQRVVTAGRCWKRRRRCPRMTGSIPISPSRRRCSTKLGHLMRSAASPRTLLIANRRRRLCKKRMKNWNRGLSSGPGNYPRRIPSSRNWTI